MIETNAANRLFILPVCSSVLPFTVGRGRCFISFFPSTSSLTGVGAV